MTTATQSNCIERKKSFSGLLRELLFDVIRTYGVVGGVRALRNMNTVQRTLLPEIAALDFFTHPPRVTVPVHYVFGEQDALTRVSAVTTLPTAIAPPNSTVLRVPDAGHMVHFRKSCDQSWRKHEAPRDSTDAITA